MRSNVLTILFYYLSFQKHCLEYLCNCWATPRFKAHKFPSHFKSKFTLYKSQKHNQAQEQNYRKKNTFNVSTEKKQASKMSWHIRKRKTEERKRKIYIQKWIFNTIQIMLRVAAFYSNFRWGYMSHTNTVNSFFIRILFHYEI